MICPHCGAKAPPVKGVCSGCGQSLAPPSATVVTGVLTPLPGPSDEPRESDDTTGYPDLGVTRMSMPRDDLDVTNFSPAGPAHADDATYIPSANKPSQATGPLTIGQRFGPRYQIIRLLGIGGMGAVYQAWDAELDVVVAVK